VLVCLKYRNVSSVAGSDAGIIIGGRIGTMHEFTGLFDTGKIIGVLSGTGGLTQGYIEGLIEIANKKTDAVVIYESNPELLVDKIIKAYESRNSV